MLSGGFSRLESSPVRQDPIFALVDNWRWVARADRVQVGDDLLLEVIVLTIGLPYTHMRLSSGSTAS
jgi:hypothetical protein